MESESPPMSELNSREDIPGWLTAQGLTGIWVELGVCKGEYSRILLDRGKPSLLYSIDRWAGDRGHDDAQYWGACQKLHDPRCMVVRMTFGDAVQFFEDGDLDFVYIDGYAGTGQDDGRHLSDWWPKVKPGGILAGHDYDDRFKKTIQAVDDFVVEYQLDLMLTGDPLRSWLVRKPE